MKYKLICCEVFMRLACAAIAESPHTIDSEFTKLGAHESPENLRNQIQEKIDKVDRDGGYEAILLGYGLCGNGTLGLRSSTIPIIITRAHDCCTIFLGSRGRFLEFFKDNLSSEWETTGYMEREENYLGKTKTGELLGLNKEYEELVEKYGEENAEFVWESLHPGLHCDEATFIDFPEMSHLGLLDKYKVTAAEQGKNVRVLPGDTRLIRGLINGEWNENEYLIVPQGKEIKAVYDHEKIITFE